ncbi:MAG: TonB-dependent receptor [Glycocaulis sp.]
MKLFKKLAYGASVAALAAMAPVAAVHAQQTASQVRGTVVDQNGAPVANAAVTIIHIPTSTVSVATTSANGNFAASGLRVGGPYRITVDAAGYEGDLVDNLNLAPGVNPPVRASLRLIENVETIVVSGTATSAISLNNGAGSSFTARDILNQPAYGRDISSLLSRDPLTNASGGPGVLQIAGSNPRFNAFAVDGVLQQDDFGLSSRTFGTNRSPISLDAIEAVSVAATDYSVFAGGFQGGIVNVVTKSGSNDFSGSAYYYRSGNDFIGNTAFDSYVAQADFIEEEYGFTLGGPILRDRLFFFVGYERFETAQPRNFTSNDANAGIQPGFFPAVRDAILAGTGYDVGERPTVFGSPTESERIIARVDWNITDDHRFSFTYQDVQDLDSAGDNNSSNFNTTYYPTDRRVTTYSAQLYSDWNANFSTTLRASFKEFENLPNCNAGTNVGQIEIVGLNAASVAGTPLAGLVNSNTTVLGGCDRSRQANELSDERWQFYAQGDYRWGDHTISFGGGYEMYEVYNLFMQDASGRFVFSTQNNHSTGDIYQDIIEGRARVSYRGVQSNVREEGATELDYDILTLFAQDDWQILPNLQITYGLRYERYVSSRSLIGRADFDARYGASQRRDLEGLDIVMPRFGFRWDALDRTTVTGGFGLFSGADPKVWFGNNFLPQQFDFSGDFIGVDPLTIPASLIAQVAAADPTTLAPIDTIDPGFNLPSEWRGSLGVTQEFDLAFGAFDLGRNYIAQAQVIYTDTRHGYTWQNLAQIAPRLNGPTPSIGVAPDGRPIYLDLGAISGEQNATRLTNTSGGGGWIYTLSLSNEFENGFGFYVSYAHQDIESQSPGSSSVAISNFNGAVTADRNNLELARSDYETEHSFTLNLSYETAVFGDLTTRFDIFGQVQTGNAYSLTFGHTANNPLFGRSAVQNLNTAQTDLLYVPTLNDPRVSYAPGFDQAAFNQFIDERGVARGQIFERNSLRAPWSQSWDLRIQQDLPFASLGVDRFRNNRASLVIDVQNFPNMLNNEWGRQYRRPGDASNQFFSTAAPIVNADIVQTGDPTFRPLNSRANANNTGAYSAAHDPSIVCATEGACQYRFNSFTPRTVATNPNASLYRIRIGLRYEF